MSAAKWRRAMNSSSTAAAEAARKVGGARGKLSAHQEERFRRLASVLSLDAPVRPRRAA